MDKTKVEVVDGSAGLVAFEALVAGDYFKYEGRLFLKLGSGLEHHNSVDVSTGRTSVFIRHAEGGGLVTRVTSVRIEVRS